MATGISIKQIQSSLADMTAKGVITRCSVTRYEDGKPIQAMQCRISRQNAWIGLNKFRFWSLLPHGQANTAYCHSNLLRMSSHYRRRCRSLCGSHNRQGRSNRCGDYC